MTTLLYCILKSRFWQRIVMTSPPNLREEGDAFRINLSLSTQKPPQSNLTSCHGENAITGQGQF
ncbi:MAG: hypothetical protein EWV76_11885 [Microcystis novacekii Mn_MB_F_20050700_S1]|uniref:Uncharacterized protein n=1 Tax=Microcystis novacekii Mn_MB_F_20050700_S1D TaxID=2486266 RepID=A0A552J431_9CHRO|nr:MAG: hypothetical protein EWV76_11885 [Microcystis novacekii Mn_MB_F_20050700_S1]TRU90445.1 MAG: hypothetical protein EWV54_06805 [Microcystis novacekii Mn_MB_F_20050700_S1D]